MSLTAAQQEAVKARGNVLVVAGAGAGKTSTLVARCLDCLLEEKPPVSLEEILMVTFTEAAAADMRRKIRDAFQQRLQERRKREAENPAPAALVLAADLQARQQEIWLEEQLAYFDTAAIGTLHSFCLQLARQHFYELELDPQLSVLAEEEQRLLADETMEKILQAHYAGDSPESKAVQQLIQMQARGWDQPIRTLALKLHHYTQTLRDPVGWFESQLAMYDSTEPTQWREWLVEGVVDWRDRWLPALEAEAAGNSKAAECVALLRRLPAKPTREQCADALEDVRAADEEWPAKKKTVLRKPLEEFFDEAVFLRSLARSGRGGTDPLHEDWGWVRSQMATLLKLAREFGKEFTAAKRELGVVDFHDLEQYSLRLLLDPATKEPTEVARQWRNKLRFVFVDEYQDINDAQDAILKALSREGTAANRFLVGDVKQSIYRFRLADPHIFQDYVATWGKAQGRIIPLADNFRSREAILNFINSLFASLMRREIGGVPYDDAARLRFGAPEERAVLGVGKDATPRVELLLRVKPATDAAGGEESGESAQAWIEMSNLEDSEKEARLVALRLQELRAEKHLIWDETLKSMRPVEWRDMAILLRSPSGKAESYAKEFTRLGIPLLVARGGFYESMEITDLLSLLQLLDNPLQDLPLVAVLRSPLVGLSLDELASVRLMLPKGPFWAALQRYHKADPSHPHWTKAGWAKVERFLRNFASWRRLARQVSLSRCLEAVLSETHYEAWLLTQSRGAQRHANVQRLLGLAQQFDRFQRQGLFRFLRFIEAQQAAETEPEVGAVSAENAVALMSIHQSKGLEFPVVVVGDLGKPFNLADLRSEIILDEKYGLCPQIKPPHTGQRYPSLPYWRARQRQKQEMLGEEMRLLYVAMTRARDTLILTGTVSEREFGKRWKEPRTVNTPALLAARNYLDWLALWSTATPDMLLSTATGANACLRWMIHEDDRHLLSRETADDTDEQPVETPLEPGEWEKLEERISWQYPHLAAIHEPAKTSVSALRRRLMDEVEDEARPLFQSKAQLLKARLRRKHAGMSAAEVGTTHHLFLQLASLDAVGSVDALKAEAKRLAEINVLTAEEVKLLDYPAVAAFWQSALGRRIREQGANVRRELPFTARFAPHELAGTDPKDPDLFDDEFVVVQGVADLVVMLPEELWLVDFKTDDLEASQLAERVRTYEPQLHLYSMALGRIYRRRVSEMHLHFLSLRKSVPVKPAVFGENARRTKS